MRKKIWPQTTAGDSGYAVGAPKSNAVLGISWGHSHPLKSINQNWKKANKYSVTSTNQQDTVRALHALQPLLKHICRIRKPQGSFAMPLTPRKANKSMDSRQRSVMRSQVKNTLSKLRPKTRKQNIRPSQPSIAKQRNLFMTFRMKRCSSQWLQLSQTKRINLESKDITARTTRRHKHLP